jgi:hypothetical protein
VCGVVVAAGAGAGGCEIAEGLRVGGGREWCHGCFLVADVFLATDVF